MKCKLFFTMLMLTAINQSFSMTPTEQQNLNSELRAAALQGNNTEVDYLLQAGADINAANSAGATPLHLAVFNGHTPIVELLLSKGAHISVTDNDGNTPLHLVEHTSTVELLLSKGADIEAKNNKGDTPLATAILKYRTATAELLLSHGAHINAKSYHGKTPLCHAVTDGDTAIVELLLSKHANINAKDNSGFTPLHWAAFHGNTTRLELLLAYGADINAQDNDGKTPHHYAARIHSKAKIELLKAYQALLEQAHEPTKALFKLAIERGYYGLVKLLLQKGLNLDVSDLKLAKEKWQTAEYKRSYKAIGRLLVAYFRLMGELKATENSENIEFVSYWINKLIAYLSKPRVSTQGPISKTGIVGLYGLPESIAHNIATFID